MIAHVGSQKKNHKKYKSYLKSVNLMDLNLAQEIFTLFFGIFYATTIAQTNWLRPFSTHLATMLGVKSKPFRRLIVSICLLNLLPLVFFSSVFVMLVKATITVNAELPSVFSSIFQTFTVALLCLAPFGFYRIYVGVSVWKWQWLYLEHDWKKIRKEREVEEWEEEKTDSSIKTKEMPRYTFDEPLGHIVSGICYIIIPLLLFVLVFFPDTLYQIMSILQ